MYYGKLLREKTIILVKFPMNYGAGYVTEYHISLLCFSLDLSLENNNYDPNAQYI